MLELLRINNLALIEDIAMEFSPGMNVLTGETGAGKSFILKALSFLTGDKLNTDLVRPGAEKAVVEGLFYVNDEEVVLRRELIAATGRSRFYINDQLSSQETIRSLQSSLLLHTSQHGQQRLLQPTYQAQLLDDFMDAPDLLSERNTLLQQLQNCAVQKKELSEKIALLEEKRDVLEYQQAEIAKVNPLPDEEEELENRRMALRNQAGINSCAQQGLEAFYGSGEHSGIFNDLNVLERSLASLAKLDTQFEADLGTVLEMRDLSETLARKLRQTSQAVSDESEREQIESRLYQLAQLSRKLKRPLSAIIALNEEITANLEFLDSCAFEQKRLHDEEEILCKQFATVLDKLNAQRQETAVHLAAALEQELSGLGFSEQIKIRFAFTPVSLYENRLDCEELRARLVWQPNPGQPEQPLDRIASGGELSRFLLALVSLISRSSSEKPTLIFDEVDAGVGGLTLVKVAERLDDLARRQQMLLITHWPQLAQRAQRHFVIQKHVVNNQTYTTCRQLAESEIPLELDRMSGKDAS